MMKTYIAHHDLAQHDATYGKKRQRWWQKKTFEFTHPGPHKQAFAQARRQLKLDLSKAGEDPRSRTVYYVHQK